LRETAAINLEQLLLSKPEILHSAPHLLIPSHISRIHPSLTLLQVEERARAAFLNALNPNLPLLASAGLYFLLDLRWTYVQKMVDDGLHSFEGFEHFLVVASALLGRPRFDVLAHDSVEVELPLLRHFRLHQIDVSSQKLGIPQVLLLAPMEFVKLLPLPEGLLVLDGKQTLFRLEVPGLE
jgi:hypothetical protein